MTGTSPWQTLSVLVERIDRLPKLYKTEIQKGDRIVLKTCNSLYVLRAIGDGLYDVSGGWFDRHGCSGSVGVRGCTWGGSAIKVDVVAACGLCLEFSNRVVTSPVEHIVLLPQTRCN